MKTIVLAASMACLALAGCIEPEDAADVEIRHVHGLAYHPGQDAVFVATHNGLAKGVASGGTWSWSYVGSDRYDYMGFTQDAERSGLFYSSGHPDDPYQYGGFHLGLRRSTDGGETWEERSLKGEVDFHALTSIPGQEGWLVGHWERTIKLSTDGGATWADRPAPPPEHVPALAAAEGRLIAATTSGLYEATDLERLENWTHLQTDGLPSLVTAVAMSRDGTFLLASAVNGTSGGTYRSTDGGATWSALEPAALHGVPEPVFFAIDPEDTAHVFASTAHALVMESRDQGATWTTIRDA